jgi:hypothetical protein
MARRGMGILHLIKIYVVEVCATAVFVVFVIVEAIHTIRHILGP